MLLKENATPAYRLSVKEVLAALATDAQNGLDAEEARTRLERYGRNELAAEKPEPGWRKFLRQFQDVLVILLLVATAISAALWLYERGTALPYEAIAIFAIVLLNAVMGYVQTSRAEQAIASLRAMSPAEATVLRDGERHSVPTAELVPGDVMLVEEGDTIAADARLIDSTALKTAEAALTGESLPVSKDTDRILAEALLGDRQNTIFSGTVASYGRGKAVVVATGMQTEMGHIAGMLKRTAAETTPLQKQLDRTGKLLGLIVIVIAVVMIATIILTEHVTWLFGNRGCAYLWRGAGRGRRARRSARRSDRGSFVGSAAYGSEKRDYPAPRCSRDSRISGRDRVGQNRHAYQE